MDNPQTQKETILVKYFIAGAHEPFHVDDVESAKDLNLKTISNDWLSKGYDIIDSDLPQNEDSENYKQFYTVYLREKITIVLPHKPKVAGEYVDENQLLTWPEGLSESDLRQTISRQITFIDENGQTLNDPITQSIVFERTASVNHANNSIDYMDWQPATKPLFKAITIPVIDGYQSDKTEIEELKVQHLTDASSVQDQVIVYSKEPQVAHLLVKNQEDGSVLLSEEKEGYAGESIDFPIASITESILTQGLEIVSNPLDENPVFDSNIDEAQELVILVAPRIVTVSSRDTQTGQPIYAQYPNGPVWPESVSPDQLEKTISRQIHISFEGDDSSDVVEQTITFSRQATVNLYTGDVSYGDWEAASQQFPEFIPEDHPGYKPRPRSIPEKLNVTLNHLDSVENILYVKKIQKAVVEFLSKDTNEVLYKQQLVGKTGDPLRFDPQQKLQEFINNGYEIVENNFPIDGHFEVDHEKRYTITLSPRIITVSSDSPKPADSFVDEDFESGPKWPSGVDVSHLRPLVKRTIHYLYEDGQEAFETECEEVLFQRDATVNLVTGHIKYGEWSQNSDSFEAKKVPQLDGYYSHIDKIDAISNITVGSADYTLTVYYIKLPDTVSFNLYHKESGQLLDSFELSKTNEAILQHDIESILKYLYELGYKLVNPNALIQTNLLLVPEINVDLEEIQVVVDPEDYHSPFDSISEHPQLTWPIGVDKKDLQKTVSREILFLNEDGQPLLDSITQTAVFTRSAVVSLVSKSVDYNNWIQQGTTSTELSVPEIEGYLPTQNTIPEWDPETDLEHQTIQIHYYKEPIPISINYIDRTSKETVYVDELKGLEGDTLSYNALEKLSQLGLKGYRLLDVSWDNDIILSKSPITLEVYLEPQTISVSPGTPHAPNSISTVEGVGLIQWPHGVDAASLNQRFERVISYSDSSGEELFDSLVQTSLLSRSATVNLVTNEVSYGPWETDRDVLEEVIVPEKEGYQASEDRIAALNVLNQDFKNCRVVTQVVYHKIPYQITVLANLEDSGETLETHQLIASSFDHLLEQVSRIEKSYTDLHFDIIEKPSIKENDGLLQTAYFKLKPQTIRLNVEQVKAQFRSLSPDIAEHLANITGLSQHDLTRLISRKINYQFENGDIVAPSYSDDVYFKREAIVNLTDYSVTYDDWNSAYNIFDEVLSPLIDGYTADKEICDAIDNVRPDDISFAETVTYYPNIQQVVVNFIDKATGDLLYTESIDGASPQAFTDHSTDHISEMIQKGYTLVSSDQKDTQSTENEKSFQEPMIPEDDVSQESTPEHVAHTETDYDTLTDETDASVSENTETTAFDGASDSIDEVVPEAISEPEIPEDSFVDESDVSQESMDDFSESIATLDSSETEADLAQNHDTIQELEADFDEATSIHSELTPEEDSTHFEPIEGPKSSLDDDTFTVPLTNLDDSQADLSFDSEAPIVEEQSETTSTDEALFDSDDSEDFDVEELTRTCQRVITFKSTDGDALLPPIVQEVHFTRNASINHNTNTLDFSPWTPLGTARFDSLESPTIENYQALVTQIPSRTANPDDTDPLVESILYEAQASTESLNNNSLAPFVSIDFIDLHSKEILMQIKSQNQGNDVERRLQKSLNFLNKRHYVVVDQNYPENGKMLDEKTEEFTFWVEQKDHKEVVTTETVITTPPLLVNPAAKKDTFDYEAPVEDSLESEEQTGKRKKFFNLF